MTRATPTLLTSAIQNVVLNDRFDELERLFSEHAFTGEQLVWLALSAKSEAMQRRLLAECRESASFHRGAVAVARDDEAAIREAHARGVAWYAPLGSPYGDTAVQMAAALGHVASLRALVALGVDVDRTAQRYDHRSPLVIAMRRGRWDAARMLLAEGVEVHRPDLVEYLPDAPRDLIAAFLARGLQWEYVQSQAALMAETLTPEKLRMLVELGMRVDERALAWILASRGHLRRPDETHIALVRELLRLCPPPASGVVVDPDGETFDLLAVVLGRLPLQVARDLVAAGVVKRKVRVPSQAPDELAKKAWLGLPSPPVAGDPALPFADFFELNDGDLSDAAILAQLTVAADGQPAFGPIRLGMQLADIGPIAPGEWVDDGCGRWTARRGSDIGLREHSILIESLPDGSVFHVLYLLLYNPGTGTPLPGFAEQYRNTAPPELVPGLIALLGKPNRKTVKGTTWLRGDTRVSTVRADISRHVRFVCELALEIVDERHKQHAWRDVRLAKLAP